MIKKTNVLVATIATLMLIFSGSVAASASDSPSQGQKIGEATVKTLTPIKSESELDDFLESDTPKTIEVDADSGEITSVVEDSKLQARLIVVTQSCPSGTACLTGARTPLANYGFSGIGTKKGTWTERKTWLTGKHTAKAWYRHAASGTTVGWGATFGPNSTVTMTKPVTAVQVTLYS